MIVLAVVFSLLPLSIRSGIEGKSTIIISDEDLDGFSDQYEGEISGTNPFDPKSRPPLIKRLKFKVIRNEKLPFYFNKVYKHGSKNKTDWLLETIRSKSKKRDFYTLERIFPIGQRRYKIVDIKYPPIKLNNPGNDKAKDSRSPEITVFKIKKGEIFGKPMTCRLNERIIDPDENITLTDSKTKLIYYNLISGESITLGDKKTGFEKYMFFKIPPDPDSLELPEIIINDLFRKTRSKYSIAELFPLDKSQCYWTAKLAKKTKKKVRKNRRKLISNRQFNPFTIE